MITFLQKGDFKKTDLYLERIKELAKLGLLDKYGKLGVEALKENTPVDTGLTKNSWKYDIVHKKERFSINFYNTNISDGVSIAIILQYGHGTRNGGWVEGVDYINPALKPVFDELSDALWKEMTRA